ncbi:GWxTD domain-containing protein [Gracilimonas sediminicola]|uniref:GWxTD domain-containing protein n=1 Tax=Gracilimonas sediminicola TaxID=2952158 RepID=A0A9X2L4P0_9BACT|nr:GWxTD domain-containing protein [Gracilimonas sediminicola]MCP9292247.1 GWxTD domain-containing protein [Gracilimonas sediminicola]
MIRFYRITSFVLSLLILLVFQGCSNQYVDDIDRGSGYNYQPGLPELRLATSGQITESNTPKIIVSGNVVYGSLVYSQKDSVFEASILVEILIRSTSDKNEPPKRREFVQTVRRADQSIINNQEVFRFEESFTVSPGTYEIQTMVTDQKSGKSTLRTSKTELPDPSDNISHITEIRILGKNTDSSQESFNQATTYDIPSKIDSLKFVFQVTNNKPDDPLDIESRLLKFKSDTTIARPMHFNNYSPSSIQYRGIEYDDYEVIQTSTRTLNQTGSVLIEFEFVNLDRGNYRLEVTSNKGEENELYKARDFSIKSPNYPSLRTAKELARPLAYLMEEKEYEKLMGIEDPEKMKKAIDRFWLSNIQNSNMARNVITMYYERVEEANKQFSNFKEGWKTDPGMIYILFGPPWYSDSFSDQMVWSYSYNQNDPEKTFLFNQSKLKSKYYPFFNYLLQRNGFYHQVQYQQINRWLNGSILTTNL